MLQQCENARGFASWDNDDVPEATIVVGAVLKQRLAALARETGQSVDEFAAALLRRFAESDVRFERSVPTFPVRRNAPMFRADEVERLENGDGE